MSTPESIVVAGAGLVGSLLSLMLAQRGERVTVIERRPDMRTAAGGAGRSINLAVSTRGLHALRQVGLEDSVLAHAIPMHGRMIHSIDGGTAFQPYGKDSSEFINSISRAELNKTLMTAAEATGRVRFLFGRRFVDRDAAGTQVRVCAEGDTDAMETLPASLLLGADGAGSAVRAHLMRRPGVEHSEERLDYGYKELTIPAAAGGGFALEKNALHIWPRGSYMLIALPNFDGTFTCTLFLPHTGDVSFAALATPAAVDRFFAESFPDAFRLIPALSQEFFAHPTGHMVTVKCAPWHVDDHTLLVGDAAHAIVPFFGQGMNCGFEDCSLLMDGVDGGTPLRDLVPRFGALRKPHADAIADMAVENFVEMRDKVGNAAFLMGKEVEKRLQNAFPGQFVSRYSMVTFSRMPYRVAFDAGVIADGIVRELCADCTDADSIDMTRARRLIEARLVPFMAAHRDALNLWNRRA
jgi:kynurenine 3-monooxygenase